MNALLVVDMQEAAVAAGGQHDLEGVVERINRLAARVRRGGGAVVFIRHDGEPGSEYAPGTPRWQVASAITVDATDRHAQVVPERQIVGGRDSSPPARAEPRQ